MPAIYSNFNAGTITDNPLSSGATTMNSTGLTSLPAVASPDYMYITLDPKGISGAPEIVKVTAHTASASSATITRAQQGTTARAHNSGTAWEHSLTKSDADQWPLVESGTYTPTLENLAIGTGGGAVNTAQWTAVECPNWWVMHIEGSIIFGTAGTTFPAGNTETVSLPTGWTLAAPTTVQVGDVLYRDGSNSYAGALTGVGGVSVLTFLNATVSPLASLTASTPFTWAAGHSIRWVADCHVTKS